VRRLADAICGGLLLITGHLVPVAGAQQIAGVSAAPKAKGYVVYLSEPQVVKAGKPAVLELKFKVVDGFHVNSHLPKSELLIPTQLKLEPAAGVKASAVVYPAGHVFSFSFDPKEKLDVYSGPFALTLPVVAEAGEHTVEAVLRYQACDNAACYPPKSLPVQVVFSAK